MAKRTAKQRAATRKLVALNKRRKNPKRSSRRKSPTGSVAAKRKGSRGRSVSGGFRRAKSGIGGVLKSGVVGKVVLGIGAATLVGLAVDRFAPQFGGIARPLAAFLAGGPIGAIGSIVLSPGGLGGILGGFGGQANEAGSEAV